MMDQGRKRDLQTIASPLPTPIYVLCDILVTFFSKFDVLKVIMYYLISRNCTLSQSAGETGRIIH